MDALVAGMERWSDGSLFEQRAAAAAFCEPALLRNPRHACAALDLLDRITASIEGAPDRRSEGFVALQKTLGYS